MDSTELDNAVSGNSETTGAQQSAAEVPMPSEISVRQATPADAETIHALMRPYVMQRLLLARTEAEVIELTRHGFVAIRMEDQREVQLVGFSAIEIYSPKLAELQCLAVHHQYQGSGVGRSLVRHCVERAKSLNVMEVMAISSSEKFLQGCGFDFSLPDQKKALFCQLRPRPKE
ncbi:Amino-acid acetyltransferase [Rubripirellula reticaptiva]|uniref:Amino-acid acetyltransferase n=2 Tax=Rubripirellula reticaptiva TaxID=2528013 RepID=A0A5C6F8H5_9BACT|nr:Amino-acid acetyltransferase [Rubripirellula reticaptiva]